VPATTEVAALKSRATTNFLTFFILWLRRATID
jgi:hypothetical protein